jgi:hypothetical protein
MMVTRYNPPGLRRVALPLVFALGACAEGGDGTENPTFTPDTGADTAPIPPPDETLRVVINEVTSTGGDQIELFNAGDAAVDLGGWYLTDDKLDVPTAYVFPNGTMLEPGGYVVRVKDEHHTFGLGSADGVGLFYPDGTQMDFTEWGPGEAEVSWCRIPNGTGDFQSCAQQTFGRANSDEPPECGNGVIEGPREVCDGDDVGGATCEDFGFTGGVVRCGAGCMQLDTSGCTGRLSTVVINEVTSAGDDRIELLNTGTDPVDLTGWSVLDANVEDFAREFFFEDGTVLAPGAYLVLVGGTDHVFGLGGEDEVNLFDADRRLIDRARWPAGGAAVSWCRIPDGTGDFKSCAQQTFGGPNSDDPPECGNGVIEPPSEVCDGTALGTGTCERFGFTGGTIACNATCDGYVTSGCEGRRFTVVINEVTSSGTDDVELFNYGTDPVDLSGWSFTDDNLVRENPYVFADGTVLAPGAFLVRRNPDDFDFGLGGADAVNLFDADGVLVDSTEWAAGAAALSWCRIPDGTGDFKSCSNATFGGPNNDDAPECGNDVIEGTEVCDGTSLGTATCESLGFGAGTIACNDACTGWDTGGCGPRAVTVVINEVTSAGTDDIEFHNYGADAVDISGWSFTDDDLTRANKYVFPAGTVLAAGAFLVVVNGEDFEFGLGSADQVNLFDAAGAPVDSTGWPAGAAVVSWCRIPDGTGDFRTCSERTFGAPNRDVPVVCGDDVIAGDEVCDGTNLGDATCASLGFAPGTLACATTCTSFDATGCGARLWPIVINEVTSAGTDDVEFYNYGDETIDLSGWYFTDDQLDRLTPYVFPTGTTLAPGAYIVRRNPDDFTFGLGGSDEVNLYDVDGELVDTTGWPSGAALVSWCRIPNGTGAFQSCSAQTFGAANVE